MGTVKVQGLQRGVRLLAGLFEGRAHANHVEHAATGRHDLAVLVQGGARVKDALVLATRVRAANHIARARRRRVILRRQHHGQRMAVTPLQLRELRQRARRRRMQHLRQRRLQQRQHRLRLRITETAVELDDRRAIRPPRQTRVQQTLERATPRRHLLRHRHAHLIDDALHAIRRQPIQRRIRAHATGVRPLIVVEHALMVLRRLQRNHRLPVDQAEQAHLRAIQERLQQHRVTARQNILRMGDGRRTILRHHHALARGQTIILDHPIRAETINRRLDVGVGSARLNRLRMGRLHARRSHHVLRERLRPLNPRRILVRPEHRETLRTNGIAHARNQRNLRADHHQLRINLLRQRRARGRIVDLHRMQRREAAHTRIARRDMQIRRRTPIHRSRNLRVLTERVQQGMFTGTGTDNEDSHARNSTHAPHGHPFPHRPRSHPGVRGPGALPPRRNPIRPIAPNRPFGPTGPFSFTPELADALHAGNPPSPGTDRPSTARRKARETAEMDRFRPRHQVRGSKRFPRSRRTSNLVLFEEYPPSSRLFLSGKTRNNLQMERIFRSRNEERPRNGKCP